MAPPDERDTGRRQFQARPRLETGKLIRQRIKLEPIDSPTLFGIRPISRRVLRLPERQRQPLLSAQRRHALSL